MLKWMISFELTLLLLLGWLFCLVLHVDTQWFQHPLLKRLSSAHLTVCFSVNVSFPGSLTPQILTLPRAYSAFLHPLYFCCTALFTIDHYFNPPVCFFFVSLTNSEWLTGGWEPGLYWIHCVCSSSPAQHTVGAQSMFPEEWASKWLAPSLAALGTSAGSSLLLWDCLYSLPFTQPPVHLLCHRGWS